MSCGSIWVARFRRTTSRLPSSLPAAHPPRCCSPSHRSSLSYLLSIPIGLWTTVRSGTVRERTVSTILYMLYSLPSFVAALYLQLLFFSKLGWLPLFGMTGDDYDFAINAWQSLGPAQACDPSDHMLHVRQPRLLQPIRAGEYGRSHSPGLHPHCPRQRRAASSSHLASRLPQYADSASHAPRSHVAQPRSAARLSSSKSSVGPAWADCISKPSASATTTPSWA